MSFKAYSIRTDLNPQRQMRNIVLTSMLVWWPLLMAALIAIFAYVYQQRVDIENARLLNSTRLALHNSAHGIQTRLKWILQDVQFLVDLTEDAGSDSNKLKPLFRFLLQSRIGVYDQLRLLDKQGKERIRVNERNGTARIVADDQLQDKSDYYYFQQSGELKRDEILMSQFDLNVELGQVELPYKPMIRFIAPVYGKDDTKKGYVLINYQGRDLLARISYSLPDNAQKFNQLWLVNDQGFWIRGPDREKEWGFMFADKQDQTFARDFPELWSKMQSHPESGQLFSQGNLFTYVSLHAKGLFKLEQHMLYSNPNERWFLIDYIPESYFAKQRLDLLNNLLPAFLIIALISSLLLRLLLRNMAIRGMAKRREKMFVDIMERIPAGIFVLDAQGKPEYMNQTALGIIGNKLTGDFTPEDLPKQCQIYQEGSERLYDSNDLPIVQAMRGNTVTVYDMEIKRGESRIPLQVNATPIKDEHGRITYAVAVFSDITLLKQQEARVREEEALHRAILDSSIDAIITIDQHGEIVRINPTVEKLFGYGEKDLIGKNVKLLVPEPYRSLHDTYILRYLETGKSKIIGVGREVEVCCKDGSLIPCDLAITEVRLPGKLLFKGILRDIRERKRIEQMQKEFIATVSHELRTPLTSISGSLKLLKHEMNDDAQPLAKELLEIANSNAERLILLVNDILDIEKLESGAMKFDLKPQRLPDLVNTAVAANQAYAEQHGTRFRLLEKTRNAEVIVDKDRFIQVLTNLLSNAAKYSPAGCPVEVISEQSGDTVRVTVVDRGPGIPESFKDQLFNKFAQAEHADSQRKGGTGLGLCIAKAMTERMGGQIGYESEPGQGSRFYIELPAYYETASKPTEYDAASGPRILICEDNKDVARLLKIMLERNGFQTDTAYNWAQAEKMLQSYEYAAMTLDLMLPDIHWAGLFEELRQNEKTQHLPVIVVSAIAKEAKFDVNVSAINIFDWLSKPVDETRLVRTVSEALASKEQTDTQASILYLEDDLDQAQQIASLLQQCAQVVVARSVEEANRHLKETAFDLIIINMNLPNIPELILQADVGKDLPPTPVMVLSGKNNEQKILFEVQQISRKSQFNDESLIATIQKLIGTKK